VALVVDSFTSRGVNEICTSRRGFSIYERIEDAYGGLLFLSKLPYVDPVRIGVIGWSHGGNAVLRLLMANDAYGEQIAGQRRFTAGVAFYPWCGVSWGLYKWKPGKLLVLAGEADQWTPGTPCKSYEEAGIKVYVFPGAYHGFDNPSLSQRPTEVRGAITFGGGSAVVAYHPEAAAKAEKIIRKFLDEQLAGRIQASPR
jgi:dienelactone hydrolase